jgi:hypothetical protein
MCALAGAIFQNKWFRKHFVVMAITTSVKWNIPGSKDNEVFIGNDIDPSSCGIFTWDCPSKRKNQTGKDESLKECILEKEMAACVSRFSPRYFDADPKRSLTTYVPDGNFSGCRKVEMAGKLCASSC